MTASAVQIAADYWNKYLEHNPLRVHGGDTDAGALTAWILEAAGDILREATDTRPAAGYIQEKVNRIRSNLTDRSWHDPLSPRETYDLEIVKERIRTLPAEESLTLAIKGLLIAIAERLPTEVAARLDRVEQVLQTLGVRLEKATSTLKSLTTGLSSNIEALLSIKHDLEEEARQVIDKLRGAVMDETKKAQSIKRIQTDLDRISTDLLDAELLSGLEDLEDAIEEYKGIEREGLTPEEYQDEKQSAFESIQEVLEELDVNEEALEELDEQPSTAPTVLRTSARWDNMVEHLGYRSVPRYDGPQAMLTDEQLVMQSQERLGNASVVPDYQLTRRQMASLKLARAISKESGRRIHAALIPPASDRVRTAGMYSRQLEEIYIAQDQLDHASNAVDTVIHELAHHTSGAEDGEETHNRELNRLAGEVVSATSKRVFDSVVADPEFRW